MFLLLLLLAAVPFVLPIISLVRMADLKRRVKALEYEVERQDAVIRDLRNRARTAPGEPAGPAPAKSPVPAAAPAPPTPPPLPLPAPVAPPIAASEPPPLQPEPSSTEPPAPVPPSGDVTLPSPLWKPAAFELPRIDWEQLVGVRMFSAIAALALVLAAVFFLRYSIDHGWLAPPIRVAIGMLTGIGLLVACELKAARRYAITANALDAAGVAILFSTFFAAHALWDLISATVTFALLALVTAVAVLLSIRRESLFIALLGLLGGFATPALLSTGENRPIPLFAYLLLLNLGLAWVAGRKRWPILRTLTLIFTTLYQWGWVMQFLTANQLSLAMGIFLVFAVMGVAGIVLGHADRDEDGGRPGRDRVALAAGAMPLAFAVYLAAVPAYGEHPALLFGFLLIVTIGLLAVTIAREDEWPHAAGAITAVLVFATWLAISYAHGAWTIAIAFAAAFVALFSLAPVIADAFKRPLAGVSSYVVYAAPALLFVFPIVARLEPEVDAPATLFAVLFALIALIAWRAFSREPFAIYFVAAFFGMATAATWSATYLTLDHLRAGIGIYAVFAVLSLGVPVLGHRLGRAMAPRWGAGAGLLAALALLTLLVDRDSARMPLWGLAILLAILNAGIFVESAAAAFPTISLVAAGVASIVLAGWWIAAAGAAGVLPSLLFVALLVLAMLAGHAWAYRHTRRPRTATREAFAFEPGVYLGLLGHLFLFCIAINAEWSTPPWPLFGALAVLTLAVVATALAVQAGELVAAAGAAAAIVVLAWSSVTTAAWSPTIVVASEVVAAQAVVWWALLRRRTWHGPAIGAIAALAVATLALGEAARADATTLPVPVLMAAAATNIGVIIALAWTNGWPWVAPGAVAVAWWVQWSWQRAHSDAAAWMPSLIFAAVLYALFVAYPIVLGRRIRGARDPFIAAIAGSAWFFFAARSALLQGGLQAFVGAVPISEGIVMAVLLRQLLRLEPPGARDLGRIALVAAAALAFATVAIPLQLDRQWITIGWALEGAALAWTYRQVPHRGLLAWALTLMAVVFVRLAANPSVFVYVPRGSRVLNWYLYAYAVCAAAMFLCAWWLADTDDAIAKWAPRASHVLPAAGAILLFMLLNIEIADFYATGPQIMFRFGVTIAQDLTYTIGWLIFGLLLLAAGIVFRSHAARIAAVVLVAITAFKAFLYDMGSLGGLYRVGSLVGLAVSLSLVALALQKFVLRPAKDHA